MSKKPETLFKEKVMRYLDSIPNVWYLKIYGNAVQSGGIPDLLVCYKGRFVALELKDPDEKNKYGETSRQRMHIKRIIKCGGIGATVNSIEQIDEILKQIKD